MKFAFLLSFICCLSSICGGQQGIRDTAYAYVYLQNVNLGKKIVRAEYGKAVMFFSQVDYLGHEETADTVIITPKYFNKGLMSTLLKAGKVNVLERSTGSLQSVIKHKLFRVGSTAKREFKFSDETSFFIHVEFFGIMDDKVVWRKRTKKEQKKYDEIIAEKKFEYKEEFPNQDDTFKVRVKDYLPADLLTHYVYDLNNGYGEKDTNMCKAATVQGQEVFYFAECYNKFGIVSIEYTNVGRGLYFYRNDSLFTIEASYEKDIAGKELKDVMLLLSAYMAPGDSTTLNLFMNRKVITYLLHEELQIKGVLHKDCIKFKVLDYWHDTIYLDYFWLEKGVGLVKWMRGTGRVDELVGKFK